MFEGRVGSGGLRDGKSPEYKILVIDDDAGLLQMIRAQLAGHYEVSLAESGAQALRLVEEGLLPDLVLLDIDMPGLDGYETLEKLRGNPETEDIPVIFLTGLDGVNDQVKGLGSGVVDYITKPFVRDVMLARLHLHLKSGMERRSMRAARKKGEIVELDEEKLASLTLLTDVEKNIARLAAVGRSYREIAETLNYTLAYVKKRAVGIFDKLGVQNRQELKNLIIRRYEPKI
jgi:DNA-binding response OmpR family regulator